MRLRSWQVAIALVLLSTALKLLVVLAPSAHLSPGWVQREELHRGNIAAEILQGPLLPLQDYHHAANVGGSIVVGALAAPFVALFGPSIFAVRLAPILFNALTVLLLFLVLERTYGRRAAWIGGLLMAVAAPGYTLVSVTAWGTHHEANALVMACLLLALGLQSSATAQGREPSLARAFFLGVVAGFSVYFGYIALIALAALSAFALLHDRLFFLRRWFWACAAGAAVGFAPWITYNLEHEFRGLEIYGQPLYEHVGAGGVSGFFSNLAYLVTSFVPRSFFFRDVPGGGEAVLAWTVYLGFAVLVAAAALALRRPITTALEGLFRARARRPVAAAAPGLACLLYLPAFALAFALYDVGQWRSSSGIAHDGRYLTPLYPFLALCAAIGFDALARRGAFGARLALASAACVIVPCFAGTLAVCDFGRWGATLAQPGTSSAELARFLTWKYHDDVGRLDRIFTRLETTRSPALQDEIAFSLAQGLKISLLSANLDNPQERNQFRRDTVALHYLRERVPEPYQPYFEDPRPDGRLYKFSEREEFWRDWRERQLAERGIQAAQVDPRRP